MQEPSIDDVVCMRIFAAVVEGHSFTVAARRVGLAKSAVSARVALLEKRLGVRLLNRTTRQLSLTMEGAEVYERCARLVGAASDAVDLATRAGSTPRGTLRVTAPMLLGEVHLAPPIASFLERHAQVKIDLVLSDKRVNQVAENIDVSVRVSPKLRDSTTIARKLCSTPVVVCGAPSYFAKRGTPLVPSDLAGHNSIGFSTLTTKEIWTLRGRSMPVAVSSNCATDSSRSIRELAIAGVGVAMFPWFHVADAVLDGRLVTVLDDHAADDYDIFAMHPYGRHPPPKVRAFVDHLAKWFATPPWPAVPGRARRSGRRA